jgi:hypothetical protein
MYFVKWGSRRYLVPGWRMLEVVNNYNQGGDQRDWMPGLLQSSTDGRGKNPNAPGVLPEVPPRYAKLLRMNPIALKVTDVGAPGTHEVSESMKWDYRELTFEGGSDQGVFVGMEFDYPKGIDFGAGTIRITSVTPTTCTGEVSKYRSANEALLIPQVGEVIVTSDDKPAPPPPVPARPHIDMW